MCLCSNHNDIYLSDQGDTMSIVPYVTLTHKFYHICVYTMCNPYKFKKK